MDNPDTGKTETGGGTQTAPVSALGACRNCLQEQRHARRYTIPNKICATIYNVCANYRSIGKITYDIVGDFT